MAKKIHILLSRESWEELEEIKKKIITKDLEDVFGKRDNPKTYEEYLEREKKNPSMALLG